MRSIRYTALIGALVMAGSLSVAVVTPAKALTPTRTYVTGSTGCNVSPVKGLRVSRCPLK